MMNPSATSASGSEPQIQNNNPSNTRWYLAGIFLFWALIYIPGLASPGMMDDADSEHAQIGREMLAQHDFVTMHVNGVRYLDKAPLPYWITAAGYSVFGVSEFSARLPLSLFALASLIAVFYLGRAIAGEQAGFFSGLVLGTAIGPYIYTRFTIPDIMVGFWLILTAQLFWRILEQENPSRWLCWSLALVTAADVLTKGLIGLAFPVLIIGGYLLLTWNLKHLLRMKLISTTLVFLAVAAPWHVLATMRNPAQGESKGFFWFYFINEQIYRYLNLRVPRDYDKVPFLIFWGLLLVWIFPWTFFMLSSLRQVPLNPLRWRGPLDKGTRAALLLAVWALAILGFFSFSTRQEYYVLPSLPALALLCGLWLNREEASEPGSSLRRSGLRSSLLMLALGVVAFAICLTIAAISPPAPPNVDFGDLLKKAPAMYKLSMGHLFDLTMGAMSVFRVPLILTGVGFLAGTFFNWLFRKKGSPLLGNLAICVMMVVLFQAVHMALTVFSPVLGSQPLAMAIKKQLQPGDLIVVNGAYSEASSVNFYTGAQLHMLNGRFNDLWYGSLFPDSPPVFEDDASFTKLWSGPGRIFLVAANAKGLEKLKSMQLKYYEVAHSGEKAVYSNRPTL